LDYLEELSGAHSRTEVIRRALSLYDVLFSKLSGDTSLVLRHPDGREETLILIP
jgi:hypothetical protein